MTHAAAPAEPNQQMAKLSGEGYVLLRSLIGAEQLVAARAAFEAGLLPSAQWPVPRGLDWRHARVDGSPVVQAICNDPAILEAAGRIIANPFFLMQVEGRDPCPGNASQQLHRDMELTDPPCAVVLVFLDDFGPDNGATRICPRTHREPAGPDRPDLCLSGGAGDVLILDARLLHGATTNRAGRLRRSLLATFADAALLDSAAATAALRGAQIPSGRLIDPAR